MLDERPRIKSKAGMKFNHLTSIKKVRKNSSNQNLWLFKCDCGGERISMFHLVSRGPFKCCGCKLKKPKLTLINCLQCNKKFKPNSSKRKYCSVECFNEYRVLNPKLPPPVICPHCNKGFQFNKRGE